MEFKRVKVSVHDEPEFNDIGTGTRRVLVWRAGETVHIFNQPNFAHASMSEERFAIFKPVEEPLDAKATATALEVRRDFLKRSGYERGQELAVKIIEALNGEGPVEGEELAAIAANPGGKLMTPAELDAEAKPKRKKKDTPAPMPAQALAPKDRVRRASDNDDPPAMGTVVAVGPEQTDVKWDASSGGVPSGEPNRGLVKVGETATRNQPKLTKAEQAAKFNKSKEGESDVAKATKKKAAAKTNGAVKKVIKEKKLLGRIKFIKSNWASEKNPRREGTKAAERSADMIKYLGKHPSADASEVIANTKYRGDDLNYDVAHKFIELRK